MIETTRHRKAGVYNFIKAVSMFYWCAFLTKADSYYVPYLFMGLIGSICLTTNQIEKIHEKAMPKRDVAVTNFYSNILAAMVVLANYKNLLVFSDNIFLIIFKIISLLGIAGGGNNIFKEIFVLLYWKVKPLSYQSKSTDMQKVKWMILGMWGMFVIENSFILFESQYPGNLTSDSLSQMRQLLTHTYSNHHPYYHTQIIRLFVSIGFKVFGNLNAAVATYSIFSIGIMAFCFTYIIYTVYQLTGRWGLIIAIFLWYFIMPFHIMYSFTMWKDVLFGAMVTFVAVGSFRILKRLGSNNVIDYCILLCAGLGMCLFRSNGWTAFAFSIIIFAFLFKNSQRNLFMLFISVLIISFVLKHPVLKALNVRQPDTVEALSIPIQQIARVVADGKELTSNQEKLLSEILDVQEIPGMYNSIISDPIKGLIRDKGNQEFIRAHKKDFVRLYIQLGLKYPHKYVEAWIDQTRGYWNAGYPYWRWAEGIDKNTLGIENTIRSKHIHNLFIKYLGIWENSPMLQLFLCIGFYTWLMLISTYMAVVKQNNMNLFASIPFLMVILTLLIATPVYAEFRYAYAVFCGIPFVLAVSFGDNELEGEKV